MRETDIANTLTSTHTIAPVGVSGESNRPNYRVMKCLFGQGYYVIPVPPKAAGETLLDQRGCGTPADVPEKVDMADVFRSSKAAWSVAQEAITVGAKTLRIQLGVTNEQVMVLTRDAGLSVAMNCHPAAGIPYLGLAK